MDLASKDNKFQKLFRGEWEAVYPSQSDADMALCSKLAFYTNHDFQQIDSLFRRSGLYREKWERTSYREDTIRKVCTNSDSIHYRQKDAELLFGDYSGRRQSFYSREPLKGNELGKKKPLPRSWIFKGKGGLVRNVVGCVAGQGGCGKTQLALQLAVSVASGADIVRNGWSIETKGPVLMVLAEDDEDEINRRLYRLRQNNEGLDPSDLYVFSRGNDPRLFERSLGGSIKETSGFNRLCEWVKEKQPVLIILDSLSVVAGEAEVNNNDAAFAVSRLSELCELGNSATVLLITHVSKASIASKGGGAKRQSAEEQVNLALDPMAVRGASALVNNCRWVLTATSVPIDGRKKLGMSSDHNMVAYAVRKTNYSAPLELEYFENREGYLVRFDREMVQQGPKNLILKRLRERQPIAKTKFLQECALDSELPHRAQCSKFLEELLLMEQVVERPNKGKGGGVKLSLANHNEKL